MSTPVITREPGSEEAGRARDLSAGNLSALLRVAGLPCVTVVADEAAAAAIAGNSKVETI